MPYPKRRHTEVLREVVQPFGGTIADIGCGRGALVGWFEKHGFHALGIDPQAVLRPTLAACAERLPLADSSLDHVLFFNSLHHVPVDAMAGALAEAARVVRRDGRVIVVEPLAEGRHFEMMQPMDDETEIRAAARAAIAVAAGGCLRQQAELFYDTTLVQQSPEEVLAEFLEVDPGRAGLIERARAEVVRRFGELGEPVDKGVAFNQPMRLNLLLPRP